MFPHSHYWTHTGRARDCSLCFTKRWLWSKCVQGCVDKVDNKLPMWGWDEEDNQFFFFIILSWFSPLQCRLKSLFGKWRFNVFSPGSKPNKSELIKCSVQRRGADRSSVCLFGLTLQQWDFCQTVMTVLVLSSPLPSLSESNTFQ